MSAAAAIVLCSTVFLLSWFHGGATPGARTLGQLAGLGAFALVAVGSPSRIRLRPVRGPLVVLAGLGLLALAQSMALPQAVTRLVSPDRIALHRASAAAAELDPSASVPVSLAPGISRLVGVELLCLAAALVAAAVAFGGRRPRRWLVLSGLVAALVQVVVGARPFLAGEVPRLLGTYANSDHVAMLLEIGAVLCVAAIVWVSASRSWRGRDEQRIFAIAALAAVALILFAGVALTGSRAAVLATSAGLVVVMGPLILRPGSRRPLVIAASLVLLAGAFLVWVGAERAFGRLLDTSWHDAASSPRLTVWRESARLVGASPVLGTGLGAFRESYTLVQESGSSRITWARAHNDYLELLVTGGIVGLALLLWGLALTLRDLRDRYRAAAGSENRVFVLGAAGALAAVAGHEFFDFGLALPANALLLTALLAAALSIDGGGAKRA